MLFSGRTDLQWKSSEIAPNSSQIYNAVLPNEHYFLAQFIDGKWYDMDSKEIQNEFKYLELFDDAGKFLPDVEWKWVTDPEEGDYPMYNSKDFPKGDKTSAWSYHCLLANSRGQIRIGKYNYLTQQYIVLGDDPISNIVAFCDINGEV